MSSSSSSGSSSFFFSSLAAAGAAAAAAGAAAAPAHEILSSNRTEVTEILFSSCQSGSQTWMVFEMHAFLFKIFNYTMATDPEPPKEKKGFWIRNPKLTLLRQPFYLYIVHFLLDPI
jgi:hypothetical protein